MSENTITWIQIDTAIWGTEVVVTLNTRVVRLSLRIDARGGTHRVDRMGMGAWEAIDGGTGSGSLNGAKARAREWVRAARAQSTLSPRV